MVHHNCNKNDVGSMKYDDNNQNFNVSLRMNYACDSWYWCRETKKYRDKNLDLCCSRQKKWYDRRPDVSIKRQQREEGRERAYSVGSKRLKQKFITNRNNRIIREADKHKQIVIRQLEKKFGIKRYNGNQMKKRSVTTTISFD